MKRIISPAGRLIVALDIPPQPPNNGTLAREEAQGLLKLFSGRGVVIKVNAILRALGYDFLALLRMYGLGVFADLKLFDIAHTLKTDGAFLALARPDFLTVSCLSGADALQALKAELPHTTILGVAALTSLAEDEVRAMFGCSAQDALLRMTELALEAGLDGMVASAREVGALRKKFGDDAVIVVPGIRPAWAAVAGDDQKRVATPKQAIDAGADCIVVGRPIMGAKDPLCALSRTIEEIAHAVRCRGEL